MIGENKQVLVDQQKSDSITLQEPTTAQDNTPPASTGKGNTLVTVGIGAVIGAVMGAAAAALATKVTVEGVNNTVKGVGDAVKGAAEGANKTVKGVGDAVKSVAENVNDTVKDVGTTLKGRLKMLTRT